jgi:hypothetical protein
MNSIERRVITPVWEWVDRPELEAATVAFAENGISMTGVVVTQLNEEPLRLRYALSLNPAWQMQEANLEIESRQDGSKLNMLCLPMGWQVNGQMREDLASCVDIDIMGSPSSNTMPIQQLRWQTGLTQDFWMATSVCRTWSSSPSHSATPTSATPVTMTGDRFGVIPNGKRAVLPVFIQFSFQDDLIASERFFFDLSALCAQSGVSTDDVRRKVFGETLTMMEGA